MTNTFRHNWFPLLFVRVVPNHLTGSHIARELCRRKDPSALFGTIKFTLLLGRKKRVALHGLYSLEIIQLPHLHQIPFAADGAWIGVCNHSNLVVATNRHPLRICWTATQQDESCQ